MIRIIANITFMNANITFMSSIFFHLQWRFHAFILNDEFIFPKKAAKVCKYCNEPFRNLNNHVHKFYYLKTQVISIKYFLFIENAINKCWHRFAISENYILSQSTNLYLAISFKQELKICICLRICLIIYSGMWKASYAMTYLLST